MESETRHGLESRNPLVKIYFNNLYGTILDRVRREESPVLDAGCGEGHFLTMLENKVGLAMGIDISLTKLMVAKRNTQSSSLLLASCQNLPLRPSSLKRVVSVGVLEHVDNHSKALKEMYEVLQPRGKLLVTFPFGEMHAVLKTLMLRSKHSSVLHNFEERSIEKVLHEIGFEVLKKHLFPTFTPLIHASFGFDCVKTSPLNCRPTQL